VDVIPLEETIVKCTKNSNRSEANVVQTTSPPINTMTNFLNSISSRSLQCDRQERLSHIMPSARISASVLEHNETTTSSTNNIRSKLTASNATSPGTSTSLQTVIRRNCSYASVSKNFPYYIPIPSSSKLNGKPKKYQSFVQTAVEQDQSVLSPSGSEGSSRDSGFNSHSSSPVPAIVASDIDQLLDEIASLDDIN